MSGDRVPDVARFSLPVYIGLEALPRLLCNRYWFGVIVNVSGVYLRKEL